jgi:energy-coupling factor transporter transmembrane protein EcfT
MALTSSKSQGGFVAVIIIALVLILAIALAKLPADVLNVLWYLLIAMIFVVAIAWLAYRKSSEGRKRDRTSRPAGTGSTRGRDEPRIGQAYRLDDDDDDQ